MVRSVRKEEMEKAGSMEKSWDRISLFIIFCFNIKEIIIYKIICLVIFNVFNRKADI